VLALQGDFREHLAVLRELGADAVPVRRESELSEVDGLVIPGGESSVMDKLSRTFGLAEPLKARIADGMPVYGTCAGLIMLADTVLDAIAGQQTFGGLDIAVRRNAFGNQLDSFETDLDIPELGEPAVHAVFIRAPAVESVGESVTVLAAIPDGRVVAVEQGNLLGTAFHPEMTDDYRFHRRFLERVRAIA
jgi:5'-phosphate synthase pdxT subunit